MRAFLGHMADSPGEYFVAIAEDEEFALREMHGWAVPEPASSRPLTDGIALRVRLSQMDEELYIDNCRGNPVVVDKGDLKRLRRKAATTGLPARDPECAIRLYVGPASNGDAAIALCPEGAAVTLPAGYHQVLDLDDYGFHGVFFLRWETGQWGNGVCHVLRGGWKAVLRDLLRARVEIPIEPDELLPSNMA